MKRFGCNRLYLSTGSSSFQQVVELDEKGYYLRHYSLRCEQYATQWLGGVCILLPAGVLPCADLQDLFLWMKAYEDELQKGCPAFVWHLWPIDSIKAEINNQTQICRLK